MDAPAAEGAESAGARLLDRTGKPMAVPINGTVVVDGDGLRWLTAELRLTPLAPGEYILELASGNGAERSLTAFRLVP